MAAAGVLIVEDDEDARDLFNLLLRGNGYETSYAADAYGAIAIARKDAPDAILLDFNLPGGSALVVLERLRRVASLAAVPVIIVTAGEANLLEAPARPAGAIGFLQEPFEPRQLLTLLEQAIAWPMHLGTGSGGSVFRSAPPTQAGAQPSSE
jgi:CheY-like chemotaxis protein